MSGLDQIAKRQLDLGPAGYFRVEPENPAGNQVVVKAGFLFAGAHRIYDRFTAGDQTSAGFSSVGGPGVKRYDLVSIDATGAVQITPGTEVAVGAGTFQGAPGFTGGPALPDQAIPCAYVLITESGAVTVTSSDISPVAGVFYLSRDLDGYLIDKGSLGAPPTGTDDIVTTMFSSETPGGGNTVKGIVTSAPGNYIILVDQNGDELKHITVPSRIYGRLTQSGGVWTLSYFYTSAVGVETAVTAIESETAGGAPTDLRLIGVPKVFSRNDPARPLFDSTVYRLSDQLVGDIPYATTADPGKVTLAIAGSGVTAGTVVQASDARLGTIIGEKNTAGATPRRSTVNVIEGTNVTVTVVDNPGNDSIDITINSTAAGAFPGFGGSTNPDTAGGSSGGNNSASRDDHAHSASTIYRHTATSLVTSGTPIPTSTLSGLTNSIAAFAAMSGAAGGGGGISVGFYTGGGQGSVYVYNNGTNGNSNGRIADLAGGASFWTGSGIGGGTVTLTTGGAGAANGAACAIGSPH